MNIMLKLLLAKGRRAFNNANDDEMVVLVENGKETDNIYPICQWGEPDMKSPEDWIRGISFTYQMRKFKGTLSFVVKPYKQ